MRSRLSFVSILLLPGLVACGVAAESAAPVPEVALVAPVPTELPADAGMIGGDGLFGEGAMGSGEGLERIEMSVALARIDSTLPEIAHPLGDGDDDSSVPELPLMALGPEAAGAEGDVPPPEEDEKDPEKEKEIDVEVALETIQKGDSQEQVQLQVEILDETVDDAEKLNNELAKIIEELRQKKGLPKEDPYVSPIEQAIEPVVKMQEQKSNRMAPVKLQELPASPTPTPEQEAAPTPPEQPQEQRQEP